MRKNVYGTCISIKSTMPCLLVNIKRRMSIEISAEPEAYDYAPE